MHTFLLTFHLTILKLAITWHFSPNRCNFEVNNFITIFPFILKLNHEFNRQRIQIQLEIHQDTTDRNICEKFHL